MARKTTTRPKVVVIGAGMSGLTAAAYLARDGFPVTVFEQFPEIGGVTATLRQDGYRWDLGPLLLEGFAPDERAGNILKELDASGKVPLKMDDRRYVFPDFDLQKPEDYEGPNWRRQRLKGLFPVEESGIDRYYRFYRQMMSLFSLSVRADLAPAPLKPLLKLRMWRAWNRVKSKKDWSAEKLMDHFFVDPRLKAVFTSILADFVVRPSRFSALGIPILNVENSFDQRIPRRVSGAGKRPSYHFIRDGCGTLVEAVADVVRENGGRIYTGSAVEKIRIDADRVRGVQLVGGRIEPADIVIATGGARETFFGLVGRQYLPAALAFQVDELKLMESVLMIQLGIDMDPRPYQPGALVYYYGTYDIEGAVAACLRGDYHEGEDGFLIYIPSLHSADMAPPGHHALTIYTIAPNELRQGPWQEQRKRLVNKLLAQAETVIPGLRDHIQTQVVLTPEEFRTRTHQQHHAFGGHAPILGQEAPGHETPIEGLWFAGSQSKSGGGVQNVMLGARETAGLIKEHLKKR